MSEIEILRDKSRLEGTCYFELLPGEYRDVCWNESSIFLAEEVWDFVESTVQRHQRSYDHYAFTEIFRGTWAGIIEDLVGLERLLRAATRPDEVAAQGFAFRREEFVQDFEVAKVLVATVISELVSWLHETLEKEDRVSVLGL